MVHRARSILARFSPDQIEACRSAANMAEAVARSGLDRITIEYVRKRLRMRGYDGGRGRRASLTRARADPIRAAAGTRPRMRRPPCRCSAARAAVAASSRR